MEDNENKFLNFCKTYAGAIIGVIVAILLLGLRVMDIIVSILIIVAFGFGGDYVQKNKSSLKEKVKSFIDKL